MKYCIYHSSYPVVFLPAAILSVIMDLFIPKEILILCIAPLSERVLYISLRMKMSIFFMTMNFLYYSLIHFTTVPGAVMVIYLLMDTFYISDPSYQITDIFHYEDSLYLSRIFCRFCRDMWFCRKQEPYHRQDIPSFYFCS